MVSQEDFAAVDVEGPISASPSVDSTKLAHAYSEALRAIGQEDVAARRVYELMEALLHLHFKPNDRSEPYGPLFVSEGRRSMVPDDIRGQQTLVLATVAPSLRNPGVRARLSDVVWLNDRKQVEAGRVAIASYRTAIEEVAAGRAKLYLDDQLAWSRGGADYLRRACQIASAMKWAGDEARDLESFVNRLFDEATDQRSVDGMINIGELLLDFGLGEPASIAAKANNVAKVDGGHPDVRRLLWELAGRAYSKAGVETESTRCRVEAAECYVLLASGAGSVGMVPASWLMSAIRALRALPGTKARRQELEVQLREAQANIHDEMASFSTELDLTEIVEQSKGAVAGLTLAGAFREFARLARSPSPESLRENVREQAEEHPLSTMMPMSVHDDEGKVVATSPGLFGGGNDQEIAIRQVILRNEALRRQVDVAGAIEPARRLIQSEHPVTTRDLLPLTDMSPFIPPGHEYAYALGFARFFNGDFVSALSILVPQVENSLRHLLASIDIDASRILDDMTQENRTLSTMLDKDRADLLRILGESIVFELENLFDLRGGPSIRHQLSHGLMASDDYWSVDAIYSCWFVFRLCCLPLFPNWQLVADAYDRLDAAPTPTAGPTSTSADD
jgi:hypothetical protein